MASIDASIGPHQAELQACDDKSIKSVDTDNAASDDESDDESDHASDADSDAEYATCTEGRTVFSASTGVRTDPGGHGRARTPLVKRRGGRAGGAPYSANYKGVREGRESAGMKGSVGRIGKGPVEVPSAMVEAMREARERSGEQWFRSYFKSLKTSVDALEHWAWKAIRAQDLEGEEEREYKAQLARCEQLLTQPTWVSGNQEDTKKSTEMVQALSNRLDDVVERKRKATAGDGGIMYGAMLKASERRSLSIRMKELGREHSDTTTMMANLSEKWFAEGRCEETENIFIHLLEIRRDILGAKHPDTLTAMAGVAKTRFTQGRYQETESLSFQILEMRKQVLGPKHPDTISALAILGETWSAQGRYQEAESSIIQILELRIEILGPRHPDTLSTMASLGQMWSLQGRYQEAESVMIETLALTIEILGIRHPNTLAAMAGLGRTWYFQGRYTEAEDILSRALQLREATLGVKHPDTLCAVASLCQTWVSQGFYPLAEKALVEVLEIRKEVLVSDHPDTLSAMVNLGALWCVLGRYEEADEALTYVVKLSKDSLGSKHPNTVTARAHIASSCLAQGRYEEAEDVLTQVLEMREEVLGLKHPDTLSASACLAIAWCALGRYEEGDEALANVLELSKDILGSKHPNTITAMAHLASSWLAQDRYGEAEDVLTQVLELRKEVLGSKHPDTLSAWATLAVSWSALGRYEESEAALSQLTKLRTEVLGRKHPDTVWAIEALAATIRVLGRTEEAVRLEWEVVQLRREVNNGNSSTTDSDWETVTDCSSQSGNLEGVVAGIADEQSEYVTCFSKSLACFSDSTGCRTRPGGTWEGTRTLNLAMGFAGGAPFSANYKGVREGREIPGAAHGVGRTGKGPATVPADMIAAAKRWRPDPHMPADDKTEDLGTLPDGLGWTGAGLHAWIKEERVRLKDQLRREFESDCSAARERRVLRGATSSGVSSDDGGSTETKQPVEESWRKILDIHFTWLENRLAKWAHTIGDEDGDVTEKRRTTLRDLLTELSTMPGDEASHETHLERVFRPLLAQRLQALKEK